MFSLNSTHLIKRTFPLKKTLSLAAKMSVLTRLDCSINGSDGFPNENSGTKPTVNPLLSPLGGGLFISSSFEGGLFERGGSFNLEMTMVSVLHKELEYKVEKFKYKKF